jgi:hypothetical protein
LQAFNPYKVAAGPELDELVHEKFFPADTILAYSRDDKAADKLRARMKSAYGYAVVTGQMTTRDRLFYARFESGPSTSTEALAETYPLAVCRLALVLASKRDPVAQ